MMNKIKTIIFATGNSGKLREIKEIFKDLNADILSMKEAGVFAEPVEDGKSFEDNSLIKAKAVRELVDSDYPDPEGVLVMADDSGLEVDFLMRYKGQCTLVEVKSSTGNIKSTRTILKNKDVYHVDSALKLGNYNVGRSGEILTLPLYMAFLLTKY